MEEDEEALELCRHASSLCTELSPPRRHAPACVCSRSRIRCLLALDIYRDWYPQPRRRAILSRAQGAVVGHAGRTAEDPAIAAHHGMKVKRIWSESTDGP